MAKRREQLDQLDQTKRVSPYQQIDDDSDTYDAYDAYDDDYADDGAYGDEEEDGRGGFLTTLPGKLALGVIVLLIVVLLALLVFRFLKKPKDAQQLPVSDNSVPPVVLVESPAPSDVTMPEDGMEPAYTDGPETPAPQTVIFAPVTEETPEPEADDMDVQGETAGVPVEPAYPETTQTPLPIILTNTPTPSPSPTPTPAPTPTLVPTATPEPSPTPLVDMGSGKVNRNANLRATASSNGKVKQTVKKGESVTLHEILMDKSGKAWYYITVEDSAVSGWMRDYVVDLEDGVAKPTATPKATETPKATASPKATDAPEVTDAPKATTAPEDDKPVKEPESELNEEEEEPEQEQSAASDEIIATGKTNREANLRKSMGGKVLDTVKKGEKVSIYEVLKDKQRKTWYRLSVDDDGQEGFMRDYVVDLQGDEKLEVTTGTAKDAVGTAKTNRDANVRKEPKSNAKVVRQLSEGVKVHIMGKYEDTHGQVWYEVSTESGNTSGYMRDYVLDSVKLDAGVETQHYQP
ncbi:MAG: SH3 domain-containing protein [Christensenellales bacterium]|nr:SH3 domain-containing protein [Christensenellales bacterium]